MGVDTAIAIAAALIPRLVTYIEQEIAAGHASEASATRAALQRLADEHALAPILPTIDAELAAARGAP